MYKYLENSLFLCPKATLAENKAAIKVGQEVYLTKPIEIKKQPIISQEGVCPKCGKKHIDLREKMIFEPQKGSTDCKKQCDKIIKVLNIKSEGAIGKTLSNGRKTAFYQLAVENEENTFLICDDEQVKLGITYLNSQLEKGYPVVVGINHTYGNQYNEKTTDHFLIIVGKGCEDGKIYYNFWDVGTSKGASADFKFFFDENNHLYCPKNYNGKKIQVTQIRRNIIID